MTEHTCEQVIIQTYANRPDLTDQPLLEPEAKWFTDGNSFELDGERKAGYAVVSYEEVVDVQPLPAGTSAQKAELIALIRALTLGKGKKLNIHTNSKYTFLLLHVHVAVWKERGLLSGRESLIKCGREILQLLEAIHLSKEVGSDPLPRDVKET
jgi:ribonuclease HI